MISTYVDFHSVFSRWILQLLRMSQIVFALAVLVHQLLWFDVAPVDPLWQLSSMWPCFSSFTSSPVLTRPSSTAWSLIDICSSKETSLSKTFPASCSSFSSASRCLWRWSNRASLHDPWSLIVHDLLISVTSFLTLTICSICCFNCKFRFVTPSFTKRRRFLSTVCSRINCQPATNKAGRSQQIWSCEKKQTNKKETKTWILLP